MSGRDLKLSVNSSPYEFSVEALTQSEAEPISKGGRFVPGRSADMRAAMIEEPGRTISASVVISFPLFDGSEFDAGVIAGFTVEDPGSGGGNIIGEIPGVSGALVAGANSGSIDDLRNQTMQGSVAVPLPKDGAKKIAKTAARALPKGKLRDAANSVIDSVGDAASAHIGLTGDADGNFTGGEFGVGAGVNMEAGVQSTVVCSLRTGCN